MALLCVTYFLHYVQLSKYGTQAKAEPAVKPEKLNTVISLVDPGLHAQEQNCQECRFKTLPVDKALRIVALCPEV